MQESANIKNLLNIIPDPASIIDAKGKVLMINKAVEEITGFNREDLLGKNIIKTKILTRKSKSVAIKNLGKFMLGMPSSKFEVEVISKDGKERGWAEVNALKFEYDGKPSALVVFRDVTDRKQIADKLLESEQKYRSLVDYAASGIAIVDLKGRLTYVNEALAELMGHSVKEMLNHPFKKLVHPKDKGRVTRLFLNIMLLRRRPRYLEFRAVRKDGGVLHLWTRPSRLKINGKTFGFQAIIVDVTERKKAEEALSTVVEGIPDAVFIHDEKGRILYANDVACKKLGYSHDELLSMSTKDFDTPEFAKGFKNRLKQQSTQEGYYVEGGHLTKDGKRLDVSINTKKINYEGKTAVLAVVRDITEQKLAEERYRRTLDHMLEGCQIIDSDWRYIYVNDAVAVHGRRAKEELLDRTVMEIYPGIEKTEMFATLQRCMEEHVPHRMETEFTYPDGAKGWFELSIQPVPEGLFMLSIDITERKRMEKISKIRERLRKLPSLSTGLDLILDTALNDLGMDIGAILIIDREGRAVKLQGFKSRIKEFKVEESYPLDKRFVELKAAKENKAVSKIVGEAEPSILKTKSIHCIPVLFGKDVYGVLAFGSQRDQVLKDSDLAVLGLYSELTSTLFETRSLRITPKTEVARVIKRRFPLEYGSSYLIKNDVEKAYEIFTDNVLSGLPGLCITRDFPPKIRNKYGLEKTPIIWLAEEKSEDERTINSLQDLSILIDQFLDKAKRSVVLLDGLEYLVVNHGFNPLIRFIQLTRSRFEKKDSVFIAPLMVEALELKEAKLIEREIRPIIE